MEIAALLRHLKELTQQQRRGAIYCSVSLPSSLSSSPANHGHHRRFLCAANFIFNVAFVGLMLFIFVCLFVCFIRGELSFSQLPRYLSKWICRPNGW